jgi:hypothetical protein
VLAQFFIQEFERFAGLSTKATTFIGLAEGETRWRGHDGFGYFAHSCDPLARNDGKLGSGLPPRAQHRQINYLPYDQRRILI